MQEEIRHKNNGKFVTLTFSEESLVELGEDKSLNTLNGYNLDNGIATLAVRRFLERWRKKYEKSVKHWFVTELGGKFTERIHLHGIIFTDENEETIGKIWKYGNIFVGGYINEKTINYIVKYVSKKDLKHKDYTGKILTSAGIGKGYFNRNDSRLNRYKPNDTIEEYQTRQGKKIQMPIYYRNKIYT